MKPLALALTLLTATLVGCGTSTTTNTPVTPSALAGLAGNWQMQIQSTASIGIPPSVSILMPGVLSVQGATVSGTLRIIQFIPGRLSSPCLSLNQGISFTGIVDASNLLTLTSAPFSGSIATLQLQLPIVRGVSSGTAQIVGGNCATAPTPLVAVYVPSVSGTYVGTLMPLVLPGFPGSTNTAGGASVTLTQFPASSDGQFPVTGTLTVNSTSCTLAAIPFTGTISGLILSLKGPDPGVTINNGPITLPAATLSAGAVSNSWRTHRRHARRLRQPLQLLRWPLPRRPHSSVAPSFIRHSQFMAQTKSARHPQKVSLWSRIPAPTLPADS